MKRTANPAIWLDPTYLRVDDYNSHHFRCSGFGRVLKVCGVCGSTVADTAQHEKWHLSLDLAGDPS